jgi:hypothetical protein
VNLRSFRPVAICLTALAAVCGMGSLSGPVGAQQTYRNIVNQRFHTVSNGPQSVVVVDVADPNDREGVNRAVTQQMAAVNKARLPALQREIAFLRRHGRLKPNQRIPLVDMVFLRQNGRLVLPQKRGVTRGGGVNSLTFSINQDTTTNYSFNPATQLTVINGLGSLIGAISNDYYNPNNNTGLLGPPAWSGTVTVLNKDDNPTLNSGILGVTVVINGGTTPSATIDLPGDSGLFTDLGPDEVLGMAQAMAQAWHGPLAIGYDAWEKGMARAIAVKAALDLSGSQLTGPIDPYSSFYYTPYYDVENQPSLGNNKFVPTGWTEQPLNGIGGMLAPRLAASGTAWLKVFIEDNAFFQKFNTNYYNAYALDPTVALDTSRLQALAKASVQVKNGQTTVEGQLFDQWFQQQYVFDTSVIPGPKLYVNVVPTPPTASTSDDGVALAFLYYQTDSSGNETPLGGTANPVYLTYDSTARLTLPGGDPQVIINNGQGDTGPLFTGSGNAQRLIIDVPVDNNYQRIYYPTFEATTTNSSGLVYNTFYGVMVGSNAGTLTFKAVGSQNLNGVTTQVTQGAFGVASSVFPANSLTQVQVTYQSSTANAQPVSYQRNVYVRQDTSALAGVQSLFVFTAPAATETLPPQTFQPGFQLISMPIQPLNPDLAAVFGTAKNATLLAQYRQNAPGDQYLRYPSLPLYQPGYGLWTNFAGALNNVSITGVGTDAQDTVEVSLQYGWNMIGNPFNTNIDITRDTTAALTGGGITIQYLNGDTLTWADAVNAGWVSAGIWGYDSTIIGNANSGSQTYLDISNLNTSTSQFTANLLQPWKGYWVLVPVTEGVTLTYVNPNTPISRAAAVKKSVRRSTRTVGTSDRGAWKLPLTLTDEQGRMAAATLGQSSRGADSYISSLDGAMPPAFGGKAAFGVRFPHPEWNSNFGTTDYLTDIRKSNTSSTWNVTVDLPQGQKSYTLAWGATARLPRGTRLTLTDMTTKATQLMNATTQYAFTPAQGETSRNFQISVQPNGLSRIAITNLRVDAPMMRGGRAAVSATISYEATGVAQASIQIRGATGRVVRRLDTGRAITAGVNQAVWDFRDDRGVALSGGTYIIEITAATPEGQQTRAISTYTVIR